MDKNYKTGTEISISGLGSNSLYYNGFYQKVFIFTDDPETGFSFYIIPVSTPAITFAYFENSENNYQYGDVVKCSVHFHNIYSDNDSEIVYAQYFIVENNSENKQIGLEETKEDIDFSSIEEACVWKSEIRKMPDMNSYYGKGANQEIENTILIDYEKWRKGEVKKKEFSVIAVIYREIYLPIIDNRKEIILIKNFLNEPTSDVFQYESSILGVNDLDNKKNSISSRIKVNADFISEIIERNEIEKNNQIQYIGDVHYTKKEFDPCSYAKIKTVDEFDKIRKPLIIFDEDKLSNSGDKTSQYIDIIRGDDRTNFTIELLELKNKDVFCSGVMLPKDEKHNIREHVFLMTTVLTPEKFGYDYKRIEDKDHKKQLRKSKIKITDENDKDTDVIVDHGKPAYDVEKVQKFIIGTDYDYKDQNALILKLKFIYNKTYDSELLNYLAQDQHVFDGGEWGQLAANLWVVRYLIKLIKKEKFFQTYFVPVSTCRYPNQIIKIRVFPDLKWVFNFNIKQPLYYNDTETQLDYYERGENEYDDLSGNIRRTREIAVKNKKGSVSHNLETGFAFSLDCEVSNKAPIHLSLAFSKKLRNLLEPIYTIRNFYDKLFGASDAKKEDEKKSKTDHNYLKRKGIRKLPISFEIKPPSLGIGIGIGYATTNQSEIAWGLEGRIIANPIIGAEIRLDLLALGSKIKPWGIILDILDIAAWAAESLSGGKLEIDYKIEIVFEGNISLGGRKIGESEETGEEIYEKYGNIKYNFIEKEKIGDFSVNGEIKGRIEMSAKIQFKTKISKYKVKAVKADFDIGVKAESSVKITIPTKLNGEGNFDVDCYFSGVLFEAWFKISASIGGDEDEDEDGKPDISNQIIDGIPFNTEIKID